jgi:alkanesulfonate monooxygenase SsuD/methylene tetrahydromethanopterin reductase-like flavin-dependent oxidoreductase (luciferase family)
MNLSAAPRRESFGWPWSSRIARCADDLGFEFVIPVARWLGYKGDHNIHGSSFETFAWAAAIAAQTDNVTVTATAHLPIIHPLFAAKALSTIDHVAPGRIALNAVMGWYGPEMEMFDLSLKGHDARYEHGGEWTQIVNRLWCDSEEFDFNGEFFHLAHATSDPKPLVKPLLLNAGTSPAGMDYCAHYCDFNFGLAADVESGGKTAHRIKTHAREKYDREVGSLNCCYVICDDTEAAAKRRYDAICAAGDWGGALNMMKYVGINSESFPDTRKLQERFVATGAGLPLIGTPEQIATKLMAIADAGVDGVALGFLDYAEEMMVFDRDVVPLLREAGLRQ